MSLENFILLVIACLAVNITPGPSVLLVSSVSAARGFRAALFALLGMTAGAFFHVLLAASGVSALLSTAPLAFTMLQYAGAAYLIFLGIDLLRKPWPVESTGNFPEEINDWKYFKRGLLVDSLNPKIALFFLAFIPQFLDSVESPGFMVSVGLGSIFLVTGAIVNGSIAYLVARGTRLANGGSSAWIRTRIPASVLIFLGLRLLWPQG